MQPRRPPSHRPRVNPHFVRSVPGMEKLRQVDQRRIVEFYNGFFEKMRRLPNAIMPVEFKKIDPSLVWILRHASARRWRVDRVKLALEWIRKKVAAGEEPTIQDFIREFNIHPRFHSQ